MQFKNAKWGDDVQRYIKCSCHVHRSCDNKRQVRLQRGVVFCPHARRQRMPHISSSGTIRTPSSAILASSMCRELPRSPFGVAGGPACKPSYCDLGRVRPAKDTF
jgi:hypothetical protein